MGDGALGVPCKNINQSYLFMHAIILLLMMMYVWLQYTVCKPVEFSLLSVHDGMVFSLLGVHGGIAFSLLGVFMVA